ncbi:MAG: (E)-4-hydroxy-3-methylbut-2-enyl-diphosphate synthase [Chlamydiae bacterium]|nr:(E)-4-hydroxy-3-methylbut-2-enyl-diphosphate synthase [Chlamydiota bacterium]
MSRRPTREVWVGSVGVGGTHPIRIQSMTTSNTRDVAATLEQILRLEQEGCEMVRVTVQGMKEAEACEQIKSLMIQKGCTIPLIADIHFYPPAALRVVEFVDKVRINPGNFADKRALFIQKDYDDLSYQGELQRIEEVFAPLVQKCKTLRKALRIGTNHGSLSDRIMNRYGDTAHGMIESALEFARICRKYEFHDLIFSMKASNPKVMIEAYRGLVTEMDRLGYDYPLHLGVTEAGEGEDGRVKSALGIGTLLLEGIGDTIRVSLTEDPWAEMDPCKKLISLLPKSAQGSPSLQPSKKGFLFLKYEGEEITPSTLTEIDGLWIERLSAKEVDACIQSGVSLFSTSISHPQVTKIQTMEETLSGEDPKALLVTSYEELQKAKDLKPQWVFFAPKGSLVQEGRLFTDVFHDKVILCYESHLSLEEEVIKASAECGSLLIDGLFDGLCLAIDASLEEKCHFGFSLLQAARRRVVKTEFISCPGCGRTLFDLQTVTKRIKARTSHLPGVRIAIMGCIVNGPGEMADADFGYVGSRPGLVDLYMGKECVEKNILFAEAEERLIALIQRAGKWKEAPVS